MKENEKGGGNSEKVKVCPYPEQAAPRVVFISAASTLFSSFPNSTPFLFPLSFCAFFFAAFFLLRNLMPWDLSKRGDMCI